MNRLSAKVLILFCLSLFVFVSVALAYDNPGPGSKGFFFTLGQNRTVASLQVLDFLGPGPIGFDAWRLDGTKEIGSTISATSNWQNLLGGSRTIAYVAITIPAGASFSGIRFASGTAGTGMIYTASYAENHPLRLPAPTNLQATQHGEAVELTWSPVPSSYVYDYRVYRNGTLMGSTDDTEYVDTSVTPGETYTYYVTVRHTGTDLVQSNPSDSVMITVIGPPPPPDNVRAQVQGTSVLITWDQVEGAESYMLYRNGELIAQDVTQTEYLDDPGAFGEYTYYVRAVGALSLMSDPSSPVVVQIVDTIYNIQLTVSYISGKVRLNWTGGPEGEYTIYRDGQVIGTVSGWSYWDDDVSPETTYNYYVSVTEAGIEYTSSIRSIYVPAASELGTGFTFGLADIVGTAFNFFRSMPGYVLLVLGITISAAMIGFVYALMSGLSNNQSQKEKAAARTERARRAAEMRRLDAKYEKLTAEGKFLERDRWAREVGYKTKEQRMIDSGRMDQLDEKYVKMDAAQRERWLEREGYRIGYKPREVREREAKMRETREGRQKLREQEMFAAQERAWLRQRKRQSRKSSQTSRKTSRTPRTDRTPRTGRRRRT